ncbi:Aste57867_19911 [Aphanomyces stellatus]|uniref:protein-tyrosine-phosphatase n=1 Tax=Aphanomyces stellatus TaxID=120398 RepID=A0A485LEF0_9STRA|nr:hypothetical protein As57867_019845 [Aphanomyces stellatus]VFT96609.1 Aste57867_19911 [Aphanomyces stellatus]
MQIKRHDEEETEAVASSSGMKRRCESLPKNNTSRKVRKKAPTAALPTSPTLGCTTLSVPRPLPMVVRNDPAVSGSTTKKTILIWDLDETLLLFSSLCTGQFARSVGKNTAASVALGESMMCFVFTILEKYLFFDDVEKDTVGHVSHMARFDDGRSLLQYDFASDALNHDPVDSPSRMRKLAYRYRRIRQIYEREETVAFLTQGTKEAAFCGDLRESIDAFGDGWGRAAQRALQASVAAGYTNLLVTNSQLVPALCKCLIYSLDPWFTPDAIYSSSHIRKKQCFDMIRATYGHDCTYIGVGDGPEEQRASVDCGMSFVEVYAFMYDALTST